MPVSVRTRAGSTVGDLLQAALDRRARVPRLLVLTILVQLLKTLRAADERGLVYGTLNPSCLFLAGRTACTLLEDPSRDPRLEISGPCDLDPGYLAPEIRRGSKATPASDLYSAGAVALALLTGRPGARRRRKLGRLKPLLDGLLHPRPERRWPVSKALDEARSRAMELFEEWDRERHARRARREAELRHQLTEAIYLERVRDAAWREQQLRFFLGGSAEGDWDLEIARRWLGERAALEEKRRDVTRRSWLKLLLTALPLAFAVFLTLLLAFVLATA